MNPALEEALKEAYATAPSDIVILETLQIFHPDATPQNYFIVRNLEDVTATLETSEVVTFEACGFRLNLPAAGDNGVQELQLSIDNVDRRIGAFLDSVATSRTPVKVWYRPYLSTDLSQPQMMPPLELYLTDVTVSLFEVTGKATFNDLLNKAVPNELYTRVRFPSLGDL